MCSPVSCRKHLRHLQEHDLVQSPKLCKRKIRRPKHSSRRDRDGHIPYQTNISFRWQYDEAFELVEAPSTCHREPEER